MTTDLPGSTPESASRLVQTPTYRIRYYEAGHELNRVTPDFLAAEVTS